MEYHYEDAGIRPAAWVKYREKLGGRKDWITFHRAFVRLENPFKDALYIPVGILPTLVWAVQAARGPAFSFLIAIADPDVKHQRLTVSIIPAWGNDPLGNVVTLGHDDWSMYTFGFQEIRRLLTVTVQYRASLIYPVFHSFTKEEAWNEPAKV